MADYTIAMQGNRSTFDPMETIGRAVQLRDMLDTRRYRQLQAQKVEEQLHRQAAFRQKVAEGADDKTLMGIDMDAYGNLVELRDKSRKSENEHQAALLKNQQEKINGLAAIMGTVRDAATFRSGLDMAESRGFIDPKEAARLREMGWTAEVEGFVKQFHGAGIGAKDQVDIGIRQDAEKRLQAAEQRNVEKHPLEMQGLEADVQSKQLKAQQEQLQLIGQYAGATNDQLSYEQLLSMLPPEQRKKYPATFSKEAVHFIQKSAVSAEKQLGLEAQAAGLAETKRHNLETERIAAKRASGAGGGGAAGGGGSDIQQLADAVIANPQLYDNLTNTVKGQLAPILHQRGFTGFGRPMGESALQQLSQTRAGMAALDELDGLVAKNVSNMGPIQGLKKWIPGSDAQKLEADIMRVRQIVGKALEGGVLRKEDELKYREILASLMDDPKTARYKIAQMKSELGRQINLFEDEQKRGGRRVPDRPKTEPTTDTPKATPKSAGVERALEFLR
jgi:hypothetical protein